MPAATVITILSGKLSLGVDALTMTAYDCQTVSAALTANAKLNTLAATFCAGESQTAAASGFDLVLTVLQDWSDPDGICWFAYDNDGQQAFFELALDDPEVAGDVTMNGQVYVTALNFGGDAGTPRRHQHLAVCRQARQGPGRRRGRHLRRPLGLSVSTRALNQLAAACAAYPDTVVAVTPARRRGPPQRDRPRAGGRRHRRIRAAVALQLRRRCHPRRVDSHRRAVHGAAHPPPVGAVDVGGVRVAQVVVDGTAWRRGGPPTPRTAPDPDGERWGALVRPSRARRR